MKHLILLLLLVSCGHSLKKAPVIKVHESCLGKSDFNLQKLIATSTDRGIECLKNLDGEGARRNYLKLTRLLSSGKVSYQCNETEYNWRGVGARASNGSQDNKERFGLVHPYISIYPSFGNLRKDYMENVIFHETIHLLGYQHNTSVEYAYSCEDCCMNSLEKRSEDYIKLSCKICGSDYKGISDTRYLTDFWEWYSYGHHKSLQWDYLVRNALYKTQKHQKVWPFIFLKRSSLDPSYIFLAQLIVESTSDSSLVGLSKLTPKTDDPELLKLARKLAVLEKNLYLTQKAQKLADDFLQIDLRPIKHTLRLTRDLNSSEYLTAISLREALLNDLKVIVNHLNYKGDQSIIDRVWKKYDELWDYLPSA